MFENLDISDMERRLRLLHKETPCPVVLEFFIEIIKFVTERQFFFEPDFNLDTRGAIYSREQGLLIGSNYAKELAELYFFAVELHLLRQGRCVFYARQVRTRWNSP